MSLRDRPGPGVQGFPILFIATAESIYVQWTLPRTWTGTTVGALVPLDDFLEGLGKRSLGAAWWVGAQPPQSPPQVPYCPGGPQTYAPSGITLLIVAAT